MAVGKTMGAIRPPGLRFTILLMLMLHEDTQDWMAERIWHEYER